MIDSVTKKRRSEIMSRVRGKNTKPELIVRKLLYSIGHRYRLHAKELPGKPDIVFRKRRKAIFVHGCFWHRHGDPECKLARMPKSNLDFWRPKLEGNVIRDAKRQEELKERGWDILVVWECQVRDVDQLRVRLISFLDGGDS